MHTTNQLSPAAFKYLGSLYEAAVDKGLNLREVQGYLGSKGIHKPMMQIRHELNRVFCFAGYADKHRAPLTLTAADYDRQIGG